MNGPGKVTDAGNSLDLLRLVAASMVLYSHQHVLLGHPETSFLGWSSFGGAGVSIFFFLSGFLIWSSWVRDPHGWRFFQRRALRIFPALWALVLLTVLVLGPAISVLPLDEYGSSSATWRYLSTALLLVRFGLPGVFEGNPYPNAVNGSLWTLPVEFFCYVLVAVLGLVFRRSNGLGLTLGMTFALCGAAFGVPLLGERFLAHFEMIAFFWWGAVYAQMRGDRGGSSHPWWVTIVILMALMFFWLSSPRGTERTALLLFATGMVVVAQVWQGGAGLTKPLGDLSYGMYIFAFPVQQVVVLMGRKHNWSFEIYLVLSFALTMLLAWMSWHLVEKRALRFKP
jgi:peptidoglycan/LPS O-acetylase OafA/YrhL